MEYRTFKLQNGLDVIQARRVSEVVGIGICITTGLINEDITRVGISHFLEHMMFRRTINRTRAQIDAAIEDLGGYMNAETSDFYTNFFVILPREFLHEGLDILSDMILNPAFTESDVELERPIIVDELKTIFETPEGLGMIKASSHLFSTPVLKFRPAGLLETIEMITIEDLYSYHAEHYTARNAFLMIIGDIDDCLEMECYETFGKMSRGKVVKPGIISEKPLQENVRETINMNDLSMDHLFIAFKTVKQVHPDNYALDVIQSMLGRGLGGRLITAIRHEKSLAYRVKISNESYPFWGYFLIYVITKPAQLETCKKTILEVLHNLISDLKFDKNIHLEISRAKTNIIGRHVLANDGIDNTFEDIIQSQYLGNLDFLMNYDSRILDVTKENLLDAMKIYFTKNITVELISTKGE